MMGAVTKFEARYRSETAALGLVGWDGLEPATTDWVNALRLRAKNSVMQTGLPTPKLERWKYTNLPAWLKKVELTHRKADIIIDGLKDYVSLLNNVDGLKQNWVQKMAESQPLGHSQYGDMMLVQAANAFMQDGLVLDVPAGTKSKTPLNITMTGHDGTTSVSHYFIRIGAGADVTVIEYHIGNGTYWNNVAMQIELGEGARLRHYRMQENSHQAALTQNTQVQIARDANYEAFTLTYGGDFSRNQIHAQLLGENGECHINGVNMLSRKKNADTTITVEHMAPHCLSKQNYRSVLTDQATGTFQGKVHVHQIAQKTDGYQLSNTLLLSSQATMNTKPELEIYADDVKCSHGATAGRLDPDALFYLQSRGVPKKQARHLLIQAFLNELMEEISDADIRQQADLVISQWLEDKEFSHE